MSQSIGFLKPTYYVLKEDEQLKAIVQVISDHKQKGGLNGHALAVVKAVHSIMLATLINTPYYLALGSKNFFLNCAHLNLELIVLGHYNAAMQNLIYSVIATIYVMLGTFIPPVLHGFKMEKSQPDDSNISLDSSFSIIPEESETRSSTPSSERSLISVLSVQSEPPATSNGRRPTHNSDFSDVNSLQNLLISLDYSSKEMNSSLVAGNQGKLQTEDFSEMLTSSNVFPSDFTPGMPSVGNHVAPERSSTSFLEERSFTSISPTQIPVASNQVYSFSPPNYVKEGSQSDDSSSSGSGMSSVEDQAESKEPETRGSIPSNRPSVQNEIKNEHDSMPSQQYSNQVNSIPISSIGLDSLPVSGGWVVIPNDKPFAIKSTNIRTRDMIGAYGVNLERQAYRIALNEYIRILKDDFDIDLNKRLTTIEKWLRSSTYQNNPIVNALYRTLFYLIKPVAYDDKGPIYTHAKEQYEKYVTSLREVIAEKQNSSWKSDISEELKECLTLTRALCEARFCPENHERLRSLLQLHEDEYDREHGATEIPAVTRENFAQVVMAKNKKVTGAPALMKVSSTQRNCRMAYGAIGIEDFLMTDIPFLRGKQVFKNDKGEERSFYYMRHPTPHVEGSPTWITLGAMSRITGLGHIESGEAIAPEFEGMLEAIAQRNESYLIQSHQRLNDLCKVENEDSRSQTLYRLQENHNNFHAVFQAVEGDLFDRKGPYVEIETFTGLKEAIKASFYMEGSPNRLPASLEKNDEYHDVIIDQLLDQVHQTLFGGRANISFNGQDPTQPGEKYPNCEWQAFILAFYILQGDDLKFRLPNVKYFCTNCKNFFDRGGNRAMAEDRLHQEMSKREVTSEDLEAIITNLIPVPLQSKGKAVIEKRLKPGLALAEILARLSSEDRQHLLGINFQGYEFDRFEVSKKEQRAVPIIEDACTLQEMQETLRALKERKEPYLIQDNKIVQENWKPYQGKDQDYLFDQVDKDLKRSTVYVNRTLYDGQGSNDAKGIFALLVNCGISKEGALQAMAQMQQSIFVEPLTGLQEAFGRNNLDLLILDNSEKYTILAGVETNSIIIEAKKSFRFSSIAHPEEKPIAVFDVTICAKIPKDGSNSNGHWTWEVAEAPV
ncbi:MAG: hypothetical protein AABZ92_04240 [Verrucomicrobiota bacterium]